VEPVGEVKACPVEMGPEEVGRQRGNLQVEGKTEVEGMSGQAKSRIWLVETPGAADTPEVVDSPEGAGSRNRVGP
jgi:hypothetical protein